MCLLCFSMCVLRLRLLRLLPLVFRQRFAHLFCAPTDQPTNQRTDQPNNQPTTQPTVCICLPDFATLFPNMFAGAALTEKALTAETLSTKLGLKPRFAKKILKRRDEVQAEPALANGFVSVLGTPSSSPTLAAAKAKVRWRFLLFLLLPPLSPIIRYTDLTNDPLLTSQPNNRRTK